MKLTSVLLIILCRGLFAQGSSSDRSIQVIRVKGDPVAFCTLVKGAPGVDCQGDRALKAVVVKRISGGSEADLEGVAHTIRELDNLDKSNEAKNVELTAVIIAGSMRKVSGTQAIASEGLAPVVKQLRAIFPYATYEVLSSMLVRVRQGGTPISSEGSFKWFPETSQEVRSAVDYRLSFGTVSVSEDGLIHLSEASFNSAVLVKSVAAGKEVSATTTSTAPQRIQIRTSLDLREGQKVVVGSATVADEDACLFLVLSARLV